MSLAIEIDTVTEVLLPDQKWHPVEPGTFDLDSYEYLDQGELLLGGGVVAGVPSTGARWRWLGEEYVCPLTAILAIRRRAPQ